MKPLGLILTLLVAPLCGQALTPVPTHNPLPATPPVSAHARAVKIVLKVEPSPQGVPSLVTEQIVSTLQTFTKDQALVPPAQDGDGWVLGIRLSTKKEGEELFGGIGNLQLTEIKNGHLLSDHAKNIDVVVFSSKPELLTHGLGEETIRRGWELLSNAKIIPPRVEGHESSPPKSSTYNTRAIKEYSFSQVKIAHQPRQPPYPTYAKEHNVQGVVVVELIIDPDGVPIAAKAIQGPGPLLEYALKYAMGWRFNPLSVNGHPEIGKFNLTMYFRLSGFGKFAD